MPCIPMCIATFSDTFSVSRISAPPGRAAARPRTDGGPASAGRRPAFPAVTGPRTSAARVAEAELEARQLNTPAVVA